MANLTLLKMHGFALQYYARCSACGTEYEFNTTKNEGCADYVNVDCGQCGTPLGRARSDFGGDIRLNSTEVIRGDDASV